jgi:MerR family transcriptional regulator/heat shock protein HspR
MAERADARRGPSGPDASRPVYVISVAAELVSVHPRTLRIYVGAGLVCPARTPTTIRLYSEIDLRRILWIRHLTQNLGVNLAGIRVLFELEERLGTRILEQLYSERDGAAEEDAETTEQDESTETPVVDRRV